MAGLCAGCTAPLRDSGDCADLQGDRHPDRLHRYRHFPLPHPRAFRHGGPARARQLPGRAAMNLLMRFDAIEAVLIIPALAAMLLAVLPGYRFSARSNVMATLATFVVA